MSFWAHQNISLRPTPYFIKEPTRCGWHIYHAMTDLSEADRLFKQKNFNPFNYESAQTHTHTHEKGADRLTSRAPPMGLCTYINIHRRTDVLTFVLRKWSSPLVFL
jgi:hypothetical protein